MHPHTLRKYADTGAIRSIRTPAGQRLFDIDSLVSNQHPAHTIVYARVSSQQQIDDLERQIAYLKTKEPHADVVTDIASGLTFKRKGLTALLERCLQGDKLTVVVAHRDRRARFGFDLIEWLIERNGGQVVVLSKSAHASSSDELRRDLLAIPDVFAARLPGLRKNRDEIAQDTALSDSRTTDDLL